MTLNGQPSAYQQMMAQAQAQPQQQLGPGSQPTTQAVDPQSQYLAQALAAMGKQTQSSPMGLDASLMASALDQYAWKKRQQQISPAGQAASAQQSQDELQDPGYAAQNPQGGILGLGHQFMNMFRGGGQ